MVITVTRLDFPQTLDVMLSLCDEKLPAVPADQKRGIEDVIFCLNTAATAIEQYGLAACLSMSGRQPPAPAQPPTPVPATSEDVEDVGDGLTGGQRSALDCLRARPGCTAQEIADEIGCTMMTASQHISSLRKAGFTIHNKRASRGKPGRYTLEA